jgi:thiamine kinase-like enzyme
VQPEQIAERIWPGRELVLEPLGGGLTNQNFKVAVDGEVCVLRIGGKDSELLAIDRVVEHGASLVASELGIGPEVVGFVEPEGYLVTRFIEGRPIAPEEMRRPENVVRAAGVLRRLHDGPPIPGRFDSFRVVEAYAETAGAHGVTVPDVFEWAHGMALLIEATRRGPVPVACHNDYQNLNFIDDDGDIRIVD